MRASRGLELGGGGRGRALRRSLHVGSVPLERETRYAVLVSEGEDRRVRICRLGGCRMRCVDCRPPVGGETADRAALGRHPAKVSDLDMQ
ncbi:hypothetical protein [Sorangium sp. So ce693]|uniref:hypothetical protein n=1 Tax=Sorangium sp. So ce693 TaxID=3133318 RepID=UPI003F6466B1